MLHAEELAGAVRPFAHCHHRCGADHRFERSQVRVVRLRIVRGECNAVRAQPLHRSGIVLEVEHALEVEIQRFVADGTVLVGKGC